MEKHAYNAGVRHALQTLGLWKVAQSPLDLSGATAPPRNLGKAIPAGALNTSANRQMGMQAPAMRGYTPGAPPAAAAPAATARPAPKVAPVKGQLLAQR